MAGPGGGQEGSDKNTYYILWVMVLLGLIGGLIWYFFNLQLKIFFIKLKLYEMWGMTLVVSPLARLNIPWLNNLYTEMNSIVNVIQGLTPDALNLDIVEAVSTAVGEYLRYPMILILFCIALFTYKTHILMRYTHKHNMKTLFKQEMTLWPQTEIAKTVDLLKEDLDSGPWAMAMTPLQFAKRYKLIEVSLADRSATQFAKIQAPEFKLVLNKGRAERAFMAQLGRPWNGVENMPAHRRALFAIFIARGCRDSKAAQDLVYQLGTSAANGKPDYSGVEALWKRYINNSEVQKICEKHAYEFTVLASLLLFAREDGVLASADFLWIKPLDRRLWYVINNVGRQTPAPEVGGIFCHWYTELALKRPLSVPDVQAAVLALELALSDVIYVPTEKEREEILKQQEAAQKPASPKTEEENHL